MADSITVFARFVAAFIWAIIGFIFWVPMIVRVFFLQISLLIMSAFTNESNSNVDNILAKAINFYRDGFDRIFNINESVGSDYIFSWKDLEKFIPTLIYTGVFYLSMFMFYLSIRYIF